jgi:hypothetical protein
LKRNIKDLRMRSLSVDVSMNRKKLSTRRNVVRLSKLPIRRCTMHKIKLRRFTQRCTYAMCYRKEKHRLN